MERVEAPAHRCARLLAYALLAALGACGKTSGTEPRGPATTEAPHDDRRSATPTTTAPPCSPPANAANVVLGVSRHVVGQVIATDGKDIQVEEGETTVTGTCTAKIECERIPPARMQALAALVRGLGAVRHQTTGASPHYGYRGFFARWDGGECSVGDGSTAPIDPADSARFNAVYEAIRDEIVAARGDR
jgi:hypothetical protein